MELKRLNERAIMKNEKIQDGFNEYTNLTLKSNVTGGINNKNSVIHKDDLKDYANLADRNTRQYSDLSSKVDRNTRTNQHYEDIEIPCDGTPKLNADIKESKEEIKEEKVAGNTKNCPLNTNFIRLGLIVQIVLTVICCGTSVFLLTVINKEDDAVHYDGVWEVWGQWESCSVTCDIGMQERYRYCSDARESGQTGYNCRGSASEYKLCLPQPCSSRDWLTWGSWGSCSSSCDVGLRSRSRGFVNDSDSAQHWQSGENSQVEICGRSACTDGSWSVWSFWGTCSMTCERGIHTRTRTCTNPRPSVHGRYCIGESLQIQFCESKRCPDEMIAFNVMLTEVKASSSVTTIIRSDVLYNNGSAYNISNGIFTAPLTGLYQFNINVCAKGNGNKMKYEFNVEGRGIFFGELNIMSNSTECVPFSTIVKVYKHGQVAVKSSYLHNVSEIVNYFSGFLIYKI